MGSLIGRISPMSGFPDFASLAFAALDLEVGVATGDIDAAILQQFSDSQAALADLQTALGSGGGSVSGSIDDGAGNTIQVSMEAVSDTAVKLRLTGPSGALTADVTNVGAASAAIAYMFEDGREGAFLVDASSQHNSAYVRKDQNEPVTLGFVDGRQIILSHDG